MIDEAAPGVLVLPAGEYVLRDSLRLRSGVHLRGNQQVRLRRVAIAEARVTQITGYGHREIVVDDASAFPENTGIAISDSQSGGFGTLVARVVARDDRTLFIDRPVERDLRPANHARIRNVFPMVAGYGVEECGMQGFIIEGDASPALLDGCRDGGVYLIGCRDVRISGVEVAYYPGDAISFQQCIDIYVDNCHLHHNSGHGLHPGSGSVRYVMRQNRVESNGACGIFYCLRTSHSLCVDNTIASNAAEGISIGERDTDHLIQGNTIRDNAAAGIRFRPPVHGGADRIVLARNRVHNNASKSGDAQVSVAAGINALVIRHNEINCDADAPLVAVGRSCRGVSIEANVDGTGCAIEARIVSDSTLVGGSDLRVGPATLEATGARHLGVSSLGLWVDRTVPTLQEHA